MDYLINEKTGEVKTAQDWMEDAALNGWDFSKAALFVVYPDGEGGWIDPDQPYWDLVDAVVSRED